MARKFIKEEIDLLYDLIKSDEEVLWKGKPKLIPNLTILTTLLLFFVCSMFFTVLVILNDKMELWYLLSLIGLDIGVILYGVRYTYGYLNQIKNAFYIITNSRLAIIDTKNNRIQFYKRYNTIKIMKIKKTIFNTASIIFDVDFTEEKMKEIGFINVDNADAVVTIINRQLYHMRQ